MLSILKVSFGALLLLCVTATIFSCMGVMKSSIKEDGKQIPPEFGKEDVTILVIRKGKRSYDKYLEKNFQENYFGKYVIIDEMEVNHKQYQDKKKYRYIFDEDKHTENRGMGRSTDFGQSTYAMFALTDRITGDVYKTKHGTGAFSAWMKAYVQALEKARQKNKLSS